MNTELMFSKKSDDWSTPKDFYNKLNEEFDFDYDPCPLRSELDNLNVNWGKRVFCNPPYSNIKGFMEKAKIEIEKGNTEFVVFLVPARTDTKWFHDYIYTKCEIRFIKGRLKFGDQKNSAPFPSMICIMNNIKRDNI